MISSFLIGFGLTFAANAAPMLITEISYPTYRAPLTSMYNSLWYSGAIVYVLLCLFPCNLLLMFFHKCRLDNLWIVQD